MLSTFDYIVLKLTGKGVSIVFTRVFTKILEYDRRLATGHEGRLVSIILQSWVVERISRWFLCGMKL